MPKTSCVLIAVGLLLPGCAFVLPRPTSRANRYAPLKATADDAQDPVQIPSSISRRGALLGAAGSAAILASGASPANAIFEGIEAMEKTVDKLEREAKTRNSDGAPEKHLPTVSVEILKSGVTGKVVKDFAKLTVSVPHVMDAQKPHFIEYMWLRDKETGTIVAVKSFEATDPSPPTLISKAPVMGKTVVPFIYCNLHGLWEGEAVNVSSLDYVEYAPLWRGFFPKDN